MGLKGSGTGESPVGSRQDLGLTTLIKIMKFLTFYSFVILISNSNPNPFLSKYFKAIWDNL